jgi:N-acyl-D-amino-acid deacylase
MVDFDIVIRRGTIIDGSGRPPRKADIAISGSRIARIGHVDGVGLEEIDAGGQIVTPGFIDPHTHLDGHVTWESRLHPLTGHGITTAVTGNCGVGFAPCRPEARETLIGLMEAVEDISHADLAAGLPWTWKTFPDYLDVIAARRYNVDIAALLPHNTLRTYVMGERGLAGAATPDDLTQLRETTRQAIAAGAIGVGSTRLSDQRTAAGEHVPAFHAEEDEFDALAGGMREAGGGVLQVAIEFNRFPKACEELEMLARVGRRSGQPIMFSCKQTNSTPDGWRDLIAISDRANQAGVTIHPQVLGRPTGAILGLQTTLHTFSRCASFRPLERLMLSAKVAAMRQPDLRTRLIAEVREGQERLPERLRGLRFVFPLADPPDYEPHEDESVEALAQVRGVGSLELMYDLLVENEGSNLFLMAGGNYAQFTLDPALEMLCNPYSVPGLGDAGAHAGIICDASATTYLLSHWTRDRTRGERVSLAEAVHWMTGATAKALGLVDRGLLREGMKADINVIDYDRLRLRRPRLTYDLPAGGARLVQDAEGYTATIVSGGIVHRFDQPTDVLSGRLVRNRT